MTFDNNSHIILACVYAVYSFATAVFGEYAGRRFDGSIDIRAAVVATSSLPHTTQIGF